MLFNKNSVDVTYEDIEGLKNNQIEKSEILDYKRDCAQKDDRNGNNLLKEIAILSNFRW